MSEFTTRVGSVVGREPGGRVVIQHPSGEQTVTSASSIIGEQKKLKEARIREQLGQAGSPLPEDIK